MVEEEFVVVWDRQAKRELKEIYDYIKKVSLRNALQIKNDIINQSKKLSKNPQIHALDKFKADNDNSYRCFTMHRIRVAFRVKGSEVIVFRCRHTSREPLIY